MQCLCSEYTTLLLLLFVCDGTVLLLVCHANMHCLYGRFELHRHTDWWRAGAGGGPLDRERPPRCGRLWLQR